MDDQELVKFGIRNGQLRSIKQYETPCAFSIHGKNVKAEQEVEDKKENNELCYLGHTKTK